MSTLENRLVDLATVVGRDIKDLRASLSGIDTTTSERVRNTYQCEGPKELVYSCLGTSAEFHVVAQGNTYVPSTVELAVSGSGHESVFVRQYTNGFTNLVRTATLLDEDGNTFFPGIVAAQGFVGDGSALTGLNAAALATGIVPLNRLPVGSGTNQVAFGEHSHGNVSSAGAIGTSAGKPIVTGDQGVLTTGAFGTAAGTFCQGNDARLFDTRTPKTHTHGSVTNDGCVGALSGLPLITGLGGQIQAGSFGTSSGTFAQGNDPRFSDARAPLPHSHGVFDNEGTLPGFVHGSPLIVGPEGSVAQGAFSDEPGTFCQGNDFRLSNARTPLAHSHGQVTSDGRLGTSSGAPVITGTDGVLTTGAFGSTQGTFAQGNDPRFTDARTPLAHSHGPVTPDGHLGGTEGLPVITGPEGVLSTGVFGTEQGTFTEGNDPRLSDARTPLAHTQTWATITGTPNTLVGYGITDAVNLSHIGSSGTCHGVATQSTHGFMSATDKAKLDGVSLRAGKADFVHSGRNFPQGTFIRTSIPFNSTASVPWVLEIRGNSYGATYKLPFDIQIQGYILNDAIHNLGGYSNGASITGMIVGKYGYELCFWFPYQSYLQGFLVKCYDASAGSPENKVYSIENLSKPSQVIKYYDLDSVMAKSYHSKNIGEIMSTVDAYTLNGRTSSYFLNWANITGKPDPVIDIRGDSTGSTTLQDLTSGTINLVNRNISAVDTRMVNEAPSTLPPALRADLKMASTIDKVDGGLFNGVLSFRPYGTGNDWTAGGAYQVAFTPNRNVWLRYSGDNGVWQDWAQVNYTHPAKHAPSIITQDPQNRFVTDAEKAAWNAAKTYTDTAHPPTREEIEDALDGEVASHSHPVAQILGTLNGQITEAQLYTTLSSRIDLVDGPDTLAGSVAARIASEAAARATALADEATTRANAITVESTARADAIAAETAAREAALLLEANARTTAIEAETSARQTALGTEVSARELLGTQLRGSYEGGDILELSSGLLYQERVARITQDSAITQDISLLRADVQLNTAAIIDEQTARADAVSAEAASRETLSTQIRGTYTGLDVSELTSGLLYSERQARAAADSIIVSQITSLDAQVVTELGEVRGLVQAESEARAGGDQALATDLTTLSARFDNVRDIDGLPTGKALEATLVEDRAARASGDEAVTGLVTSLQASVSTELQALSSAITAEQTTRTDADSAEAADREALAVQLRGGYTGSNLEALTSGLLFTEREARAAADTAEVAARESMAAQLRGGYTGTDIGYVTSGLLYSEKTARVAEDAALATQISSVSANLADEVTNRTAAVSAEETARIAGDSAEATARETLAAQMRGSYTGGDIDAVTSGLLYSERIARATEDQALTQSITNLTSVVTDNHAAVTSAQTALSSDVGALASDVTTLNTAVGGHTASLQVLGESVDGLSAQYYVKTDVNGYVAGFGLANDGATSEFIVAADKFAIVTPGAPAGSVAKFPFTVGTVNGVSTIGINGALVVDGTINGMTLANGSITADKVAAGAITADKIGADQVSGQHIAATSEITLNEGGKLTVGQNNIVLDSDSDRIVVAPNNGTIIGYPVYDGVDYCELRDGEVRFMYWNESTHVLYNSLKRVEFGLGVQNNQQVTIPGVWKQQPKIIVSPSDIMCYNKYYSTANQSLVCTAENIIKVGNTYKFTPKAFLRLTDGVVGNPIDLHVSVTNDSGFNGWTYGNTTSLNTVANTTSVTVSGTIGGGFGKKERREHYDTGEYYYVYTYYDFYVQAWLNIDGVDYYIGQWGDDQPESWTFTKTVSGLLSGVHTVYLKLAYRHPDDVSLIGGIGWAELISYGNLTASSLSTNQASFTALAAGTLNYMAVGE